MPKNFKFAVFSLALTIACGATFAAAQTSGAPATTGQSPSASSQANPGGQTAGTAGETQGAPAHSQVDETIAWLTESVNLTPDQQNKLRPILQGEVSQMSAVNSDSTLTPEQKQQKMVDIRRSAGPQIQSVLTPEQQQKLTQMRQAQQGGASPQR